MNKNIKILITAANGHTGLPAARELISLGFSVRAMVRNENGKGAIELKKLGAEIFIGDMEDIRDYRLALEGVTRAYFCAPFAKNTLFKTIAFIIAAEEAKLEHIVYMSQWLLTEDHHAINTKEQWLGEQVVKMHKNVTYTFVNPGLFGFTYFFTIESIAQLGLMPTPIKGAATKEVGLNAPPSEDDQGRVIAHILKKPSDHIGKVYRPTGPKLISQKDVAKTFEKVLKRKVKIMEVDENMLLKSLKAAGFPIYDYSNIRYYLKDLEQNAFSVGGGVTTVVKDITGREAESFETIVRREIQHMPEAKISFMNKLRAIKNFMKIIITKKPDLDSYEKMQAFPRFLKGMKYAKENKKWVSFHS